MRSSIGLYPGGGAGVGLLLLRVSVAGATLAVSAALAEKLHAPQLVGILIAIGLFTGLKTRPLAGAALALHILAFAVSSEHVEGVAINALAALALCLTGAGSYSADARFYGRRTVTLRNDDDTIV